MANVLIAGCGYVGTALGQRLVEAGHDVWGMRRTLLSYPDGIRTVQGDLSRPVSFASWEQPFDYAVCAIGASGQSEDAYRTAYVDCVRNLVNALFTQAKPPRRILFTSSTGVYVQDDGSWVDENSPAEPTRFSGRLVLEGEGIVRDSGIGVTLRLGGIYGPGRARLIETVRNGSARLSDGPARYLNLNHRDDCAGILEHLMFLDNPEDIYLGCDGNPEDRNTVLKWIAERLNVEMPPTAAEGEQLSARQATNKRCDNQRLLDSGYTFRYPDYRSGYESLL